MGYISSKYYTAVRILGLYKALGVSKGVEILLYYVTIGGGVLESVLG